MGKERKNPPFYLIPAEQTARTHERTHGTTRHDFPVAPPNDLLVLKFLWLGHTQTPLIPWMETYLEFTTLLVEQDSGFQFTHAPLHFQKMHNSSGWEMHASDSQLRCLTSMKSTDWNKLRIRTSSCENASELFWEVWFICKWCIRNKWAERTETKPTDLKLNST